MLLTKTVMVKWFGKTKQHYESKGYVFTKFGEEFECSVEDLTEGSHCEVECICDYCNKKCKSKAYATYVKLRKEIKKDCCTNCQGEKTKEIMMLKYGGHYNKTQEGKDKISKANTGRSIKNKHTIYDIEFCKNEFSKKGLILLEEKYESCSKPMAYICSNHKNIGIQYKSLICVMSNRCVGCPRCAIEYNANNQRLTQEEVCKRVLEYTDNNCVLVGKYIDYNSEIQLKCSCGEIFAFSSLRNLKRGTTRGCSKCSQSRYSRYVEEWLISNNVEYVKEKFYDDLKGDRNILKFDFYCNNQDILIEVDGEYHFYNKRDNDYFFKQIKYDKLKNKYCLKNNIKLLRIPYWEFSEDENFKNILEEIFIDNKYDNDNMVKKINHYGETIKLM